MLRSRRSRKAAPQGHRDGEPNKEKEAQTTATPSTSPLKSALYIPLLGGDMVSAKGDTQQQPPQQSNLVDETFPNYTKRLKVVEEHFRLVSLGGMFAFLFLLWATALLAETHGQNLEMLLEEKVYAFVALVALFVGLVLRLLSLFMFRRMQISGLVFLGVTVQLIALTSNAIMATGYAPVLLDPVTGARVHLVRWCECTVLSFLMTFAVDGSDLPMPNEPIFGSYLLATTQALSTSGITFPFYRNHLRTWWMSFLGWSLVLFSFVFVRIRYKENRLKTIPNKGMRLDEVELNTRVRLSLSLLKLWAFSSSVCITIYLIVACYVPLYAPEGSSIRYSSVPMLSDCICDVLLKLFYMNYITALHTQVFDEDVRSRRRLTELRTMIWFNSLDVLAISVQTLSGRTMTTISPAFFRLLRKNKQQPVVEKDQEVYQDEKEYGMMFEFDIRDLQCTLKKGGHATPVVKPKLHDQSELGGLNDYVGLRTTTTTTNSASEQVETSIGDAEMQSLAKLLARSWQTKQRDALFSHEILCRSTRGQLEKIQCEAKVTRVGDSSLFIMVRDTSERLRRFEAEKRALSEAVARSKDTEANRFTRHEVKNGLLAAMGLCDSLDELTSDADLAKIVEGFGRTAKSSKTLLALNNVTRLVGELDSTLHEVLDTVLTEAMVREVIYRAYTPRLERVVVKDILNNRIMSSDGSKTSRFPVTCSPPNFPVTMLDRQLLKCIHRNALSNACKYGKLGGPVDTHVSYDSKTKMFHMDVINLPGDYHEDILKLGPSVHKSVFTKGTRLHDTKQVDDRIGSLAVRHSSGDGAWIMEKCAKTLQGDVEITFEKNRTVFSFRCPTEVYVEKKRSVNGEKPKKEFEFPKDTWGIAIDDSKMQRKLMKRFFAMAGIAEDRVLIQGETNEEITGFDDFVVDFVEHHADAHVLLIADENLDLSLLGEEITKKKATVSGSILVQRIRQRLLPEQEQQILALVRSANDSSHDIAIYNSRAHGFVAKAPIKKGAVLEAIIPHWEKRFSNTPSESGERDNDQGDSLTQPKGKLSTSKFSVNDDDIIDFEKCLKEHVAVIESIMSEKSEALPEHWWIVWERLHLLKGDLLSGSDLFDTSTVVSIIDDLRGVVFPVDFFEKWSEVKEQILAFHER